MTSNRKYRKIECHLSEGNIIDSLSSFLMATGYVHDNEEVVKLEMGALKNGVRKIEFTVIRNKEVKVIELNG